MSFFNNISVRRGKCFAAVTASLLGLAACATLPSTSKYVATEATVSKVTSTQDALLSLGRPNAKIPVAVYGFEDKTGQFRPSETGQTLSRAVTQGSDAVLIKALQDAGNRQWFTVIERSSLNNLVKERQIITEMRQRYLGETGVNADALPPLLFAGVLLEGGIVGYDTNTLTGGAAARYLGIGVSSQYRQNVVSVYLRAVSVKTGEVMASVVTEKSIASVGLANNTFKFVSFDEILEADIGFTSNEPGLLALRQAIEKSVYALIMEGVDIGLWQFLDRSQGFATLQKYKNERDGIFEELKQPAAPRLAQSKNVLAQTAQVRPGTKPPAVSSAPARARESAPVNVPAVRVQKPTQPKKQTPSPQARATRTSETTAKKNPYNVPRVKPPKTTVALLSCEDIARSPNVAGLKCGSD